MKNRFNCSICIRKEGHITSFHSKNLCKDCRPGSSPSNRKLLMLQIEKKVCLEDNDSLILPQLSSSVLQSNLGSVLSEGMGAGLGCLDNKLETLAVETRIVSKNLFQ